MQIEQKQNRVYRPQSEFTLSAEETNQVTTELENVITEGGLTPNAGALTQVRDAINNIVDTAANNLQTQIDAITSASDVFDVVGTYAQLQAYDTASVPVNDIIKVLQDETRQNAATYYRWNGSGWVYIGAEGPYYTKSEIDADFATKAELPGFATSSTAGILKPDGVTATVDGAGTLSLINPLAADGTTIQNNSGVLSTVAVKDQNASSAIKFWQGTKAQYDAIGLKDPNTIYNVTDELSYAVLGVREIGEIVPSILPLTDAGLHLLDGALISGSGSYSAFVDYIAGLVSRYPGLFVTESTWQTSVTTYGVCGKFVYNSTNNTVRLPKITGIMEGTIDTTALGDLVEAGLPNITGQFAYDVWQASNFNQGAFYNNGGNKCGGVSGDNASPGGNVAFDASRSSSIYGKSNTVQPQAIRAYYYIVVANSTKTEIEVDIDKIATDVNSKADTDLSNVNATGTSLAAGWAMPSDKYIDLTLGASGSTYTAPAKGYFFLSKRATAQGQYCYMYNTTTHIHHELSSVTLNADLTFLVPFLKGQTARINYNINGELIAFRFYYLEGSKSEAN